MTPVGHFFPLLPGAKQVSNSSNQPVHVRISLRVKLLIGFSIVFSFVFAGAFYWFYSFATEKTMTRLRADMRSTLEGAVKGVDVNDLLALYRQGERNPSGFSDDPRYQKQLAWFQTVHQIEPRVWLYSYIVAPAKQNRRVGASPVQPDRLEIIYLVDLWAAYHPEKASKFLEPDVAGGAAYQILREKRLIEESKIYQDKWGSWLSASAPLLDKQGNVAAVLGLDLEASYVLEVQEAIRDRVLASFVITYGVLFVLIYVLSGILTKHLRELTQSAEQTAVGNYNLDLSSVKQSAVPDEMNVLAQMFENMVDSIRLREQQIREGKQIEDEVRLELQQERELNELKSRFVSMVSHELRTPLTVLRTSLELLQRYGHVASEDKKAEYFQRCRAAIHTMTQLLEDVLAIGKSEAGKLQCNPIPIDLQSFCLELLEEMRVSTQGSHFLKFLSNGNCTGACLDKALLRSILTNLLSNAIKYSPPGSTVEFNLTCSRGNGMFEIRDSGIGIPKEDQSRLFELFHRASNASMIRGTGLGLAIVKQCVTHHGGEISFSTQQGVGTTFTVKLPLYLTQETEEKNEGRGES
jgi:signal transduction histidine kinase